MTSDYKQKYVEAPKCYRYKNVKECKNAEKCDWFAGYTDAYCYPKELNKEAKLTSGMMASSELTEYRKLVDIDEKNDKLINDKITETTNSIIKKIEDNRRIHNFLYYLTTYEKINLLNNDTTSGSILLFLVSMVNNILKENGLTEMKVETLAPAVIDFIKKVRD